MHVAFIIAGSIVGVGTMLYIHHRLTWHPENTKDSETLSDADAVEATECCGMHITCERDSLSPVFNEPIEYFDDEELDAFAGRDATEYAPDEIEQFRDVLLTLPPGEIAQWARSIQRRGIVLPTEVRDELFIIVNEARQQVNISA